MTHLYVGIDSSKRANTLAGMDDNSKWLIHPTDYNNNKTGAEKLIVKLIAICEKFHIENLWIGTEATGVYDWHLMETLNNDSQLTKYNLKLYRFNPLHINRFKKSLPRKGKTDRLDAKIIAKKLKAGELPHPYQGDEAYLPFRLLTRHRFHIQKLIAREKSYFLTRLFLKFSSYENAKAFSNIFGATSSAFLTEFMSLSEIEGASMEHLLQFIIDKGRNRFKEPEKTVEKLRYAVRESYRIRPELNQSLHLVLASSLQTIRGLKDSLKPIDEAIEKELAGFQQTLSTIPGFGLVITAGIIAEIGDISKFKDHYKLASKAGLVWHQFQSGGFKAEETRLSKEGNKYLRFYLVEAADHLRKRTIYYKKFYQKKYNEVTKHKHKRALVLTARKIVKLVFAMLSNGTIYKEITA